MAEKMVENVDKIKSISELKADNKIPAALSNLRDIKRKLDAVGKSLEDIKKARAEAQREIDEKPTEQNVGQKVETQQQAQVVSEKEAAEKTTVEIKVPEPIKTEPVEEAIEVKETVAEEKPASQPKPEPQAQSIVTPSFIVKEKHEGYIISEKPSSRVRQFDSSGRKDNRPPRPQDASKAGPRHQGQAGKPQGQGGKPFVQGGKPQTQPRPNKPASSGKPFVPVNIAPPPVASAKDSGKDKVKTIERKEKAPVDGKGMSKRTLVRRGFIVENTSFDDEGGKYRKVKTKKAAPKPKVEIPKIEKAVITTENLTVKMLSEKIGVPAQEILKKLLILGIMTNINSVVDYETMELVADEFGVKLEKKVAQTKEEELEELQQEEDRPEDLQERPPIVTVMGHVDHGKTSLLDAIRKTNVIEGEAGGITQHIGAYSVVINDKKITFIDTPGHEAFTAMRARGAKVTDIAILVVAADDGVMPQTIEAINHAKAANVPIIIAVNKIDKPTANPQRVLQQLADHEVLCEAWGGDCPAVEISAKQNLNIDKLLNTILVVAEVNDLKANPNRRAKGTIVEAKLDKSKGPVATIIVQNGTLRIGDTVVSGTTYGNIRAMLDDKGRAVKEAGPSMAVSVLGLSEVPSAGDVIYAVDEKLAKQVVSERLAKQRNELIAVNKMSLDDVFNKISEGQIKDLNLIVKADVQGSVEALKSSLAKLSNEEVRVNTIHAAVGAINRSDIMLAEASKAIIIGFNVRADSESKIIAEQAGIDIKIYKIIYEAIEDIEAAIKGMRAPKYKEIINGSCEVREVFNITGSGIVAGCYVTSGKILRSSNARVYRNDIVVFDGNIGSLKRMKDDVKEVAAGYECGVTVQNFTSFEKGDVIESYTLERINV